MKIAEMTPTRTLLQVDMRCPGLVVLSNVWFPGWVVSVDGKESTLDEAYGFLQSVVVPQGRHAVEFRYVPVLLYTTLALAIVSIATTVVAAVRIKP